jgi:hypothetical protein
VRVTRIFVEAFKDSDRMRDANGSLHEGEKVEYTEEDVKLLQRRDLKVMELIVLSSIVTNSSSTDL